MVWGAIYAYGPCGLKIFDKGIKINAIEYLKVLDSTVKDDMEVTGTTIFQQDFAPCHTAHVVKNGLPTMEFSSWTGHQIHKISTS